MINTSIMARANLTDFLIDRFGDRDVEERKVIREGFKINLSWNIRCF
jgi:hypothetical protein